MPCVGLIILLVIPDLKVEQERQGRAIGETRRLRERQRKDRQIVDARHADLSGRLDVHDKALGVDTSQRAIATGTAGALPRGVPPQIPNPESLEWYYVMDGERVGPVGFTALRNLFRSQVIDEETLVWCEHMADWAAIADMGDLEDALCA